MPRLHSAAGPHFRIGNISASRNSGRVPQLQSLGEQGLVHGLLRAAFVNRSNWDTSWNNEWTGRQEFFHGEYLFNSL